MGKDNNTAPLERGQIKIHFSYENIAPLERTNHKDFC
jgi:hypothetical protein